MGKRKSSGRKKTKSSRDFTKKVATTIAVTKDIASILLAIKSLLD